MADKYVEYCVGILDCRGCLPSEATMLCGMDIGIFPACDFQISPQLNNFRQQRVSSRCLLRERT